jgi:serine/threonine-protein kinase HipA
MQVELIAYLDGERVGRFSQNSSGAIEFRYDEDLRPTTTSLSIAMPFVPGARYGNRVARPFLQGLLSDDPKTLANIAASHHTTPGSPMNVLRYVGRDTAGAVQLLPPGVDSDDAAQRTGDISWLGDFDRLIADIANEAGDWVRERDEIRWSLAGMQPKVALYQGADGRWGVPKDSTPTTHILKPAARGRRHDLNEFLSMRAARHLDLPVADHGIITTGSGDHVFVARRYDRAEIGGRLHRLHQEDFAQALSVDPAYKYQTDGGPGVADFARVLTALPASEQERARRQLFEALVLTVAALNTDAHAKNYSVVHLGPQMRLAPLYDLGSNVLYDGTNQLVSSVRMGGEWSMDRIGRNELLKVAKTLKVETDAAVAAVDRIREGIADAYLAARADLVTDDTGFDYADRMVDAIAARAKARGWID